MIKFYFETAVKNVVMIKYSKKMCLYCFFFKYFSNMAVYDTFELFLQVKDVF